MAWLRGQKSDVPTVDGSGIRRSPVEVGRISHFFIRFHKEEAGGRWFRNFKQPPFCMVLKPVVHI